MKLTVAQLIRQLQELSAEEQELPVVRADTDWGWVKIDAESGLQRVNCSDEEQDRGWTIEYLDEPTFKAIKIG